MTCPANHPAPPLEAEAGRPRRQRIWLFAPLLILLALIALFLFRLESLERNGPDDSLPNALAGRAAPHLRLPLLIRPEENAAAANNANKRGPGAVSAFFDSAAFKGRVTLVNFWGSWCPPCRMEHPFLMELAANPQYAGAFRLVGVNYKDNADNAARFLGSFGNPFAAIGFDGSGRAAIDWGVYGPPETFILSKSGIILYRFIGPMNAQSFKAKIWPIIQQANARP